MIKARDIAIGRWFEILTHFGIDSRHLKNTHTPCPCCGGADRFRWDNKNGTGSHYCSGCGAGDGFALLEKFTGRPFSELAASVEQYLGKNVEPKVIQIDDGSQARARMQRIGRGLQPLTVGDVVHRYLNNRGIDSVPSDYLRIHPALDYWHATQKLGTYPAMVAAFTHADGRRESYHITYLSPEGRKADVPKAKKAAGTSSPAGLKGAAIRLSPVSEHIGLTEGIESALSVKKLYGIDCWATYSANGMIEFIPPKGVKAITIYPDIDQTFTGQAAAYTLAKRLVREGYSVTVADHLPMGTDYNDILTQGVRDAV